MRQIRLYERVCGKLEEAMRVGALRPGDRLPSVRRLSVRERVSISTAFNPSASMSWSVPKYAGDSMAMASPWRATARSESCTASMAPVVMMKSSGESVQPHSSDRLASWRRNDRAPGGSS